MKARSILGSVLLVALALALTGSGMMRVGAAPLAQGGVPGDRDQDAGADAAPGTPEGRGYIEDYVVADDLIVTGSECLGYDCLTDGSENFGFDTMKLKENNLQIYLDDTSTTGGFPFNDWRIIANDSSSGGASYLKIVDATNNTVPFKIMAGAPTNSLYAGESGSIGLGTSIPAQKLHLMSGNTPAVRLEQDESQGQSAQTWDVGVSSSGFFVRDSSADQYPLKIETGAPSSTLWLRSDGSAAIGTAPQGGGFDLTVHRTGEDSEIVVSRGEGGYPWGELEATDTAVQIGSLTDHPLNFLIGGVERATLDSSGNLTIEGALTEASDANRKENFCAADPGSVLQSIAALPIYTWNYIGDTAPHMGPTAQDFHAAFGLGADDKHIAPLDANGVALAGIQELYSQLQAEQAETARLSAENEDLRQRLDKLEALVEALLAAQAAK